MNDRFNFRIWNKQENKYLDGIFAVARSGRLIMDLNILQDYDDKSSDCIIEQCTGLKDKNGNLIYEGDVLLCERKIVDCATGAEIYYKSSGVVQREKNGQYFINGKDWYGSDITFYNECAEIIGNIHEQAEQKGK